MRHLAPALCLLAIAAAPRDAAAEEHLPAPLGAFGKTDAPAADFPKSDPAHVRQRRASGELSELASGSLSSSSGKWERQRAFPRTLLGAFGKTDAPAADFPKSDRAHVRQRRASGELSELASGSLSSSSGKWERQRAFPRTLLEALRSLAAEFAVSGSTHEQGLSGLLQVVPPLRWTTPEEIESAWNRVKAIRDPRLQVAAIESQALYSLACRGLVNFRAMSEQRPDLEIAFRDDERGRNWVQPHMARLLASSLERFRRRRRDASLMIGDISQQGCGQLEYGAIVKMLHDGDDERPATELLAQARLVLGEAVVRDVLQERDLEGRAVGPATLSETRLVGHDFDTEGRLILRSVTRRFEEQRDPSKGRVERMLDRAGKLAAGVEAAHRRVRSWTGRWTIVRHVHHFVGRYRQLIAVATRRLDPQTPLREQLDAVVELRLSRFDPKKPLSFKEEQRWVKRPGEAPAEETETPAAPRWERWAQVRQAGHQTHLAGRDADLSYFTDDDKWAFTVAPEHLDAAATWEWFETLDEVARRSGSEVESILIGPRVRRQLARKLPEEALESRLYKKVVRVVAGHDGHHHVRVAPPPEVEAPLARRWLRPLQVVWWEFFGP